MQLLKKIILISLLLPSFVFATIPTGWNAISSDVGGVQPNLINGNNPYINIRGFNSTASSTIAANLLNIMGLVNGCVQIASNLLTSTGSACGTASLVGTTGQVAYFSGTNTAVGTSTIFITPAGVVGVGTITPTDVNTNSKLTVSSIGSTDIIASTTDNTTLSDAIVQVYAPGSRMFMGAHGTNQVSSRYGITLGGYAEIGAFNSTFGSLLGLIIGTNPAVPIIFGTNNVERMRILSNGNVGVASTSPGSLFSVGGDAVGINFGLATSTWSTTGGINLLKGGCFAINSVCIGSGSGSGTLTALGDGWATTTGTAITLSTTTSTINGLTSALKITTTASALTFTPSLSGILTEAGGGTAQSTYAVGDLLYASGVNTLSKRTATTNGFVLALVNGVPTWVATTTLTTITGTLPVVNGGTNSTSFAGNSIITSNSAGNALIATGTQLTVGNILATTTAVNQFNGVLVAPDGTLSNPAFSFSDDQNNGIYSPANDIFAILTNGVERFRINDSSGYSSFGTTTEGLSILTLGSSTAPQLAFSDNTGGDAQWTMRNAGGNFYLASTSVAGTATSSTATLTVLGTSGFVGIGNTNPTNPLYIQNPTPQIALAYDASNIGTIYADNQGSMNFSCLAGVTCTTTNSFRFSTNMGASGIFEGITSAGALPFAIRGGATNRSIAFLVNGGTATLANSAMWIDGATGNIAMGQGYTTPTYKLDLNPTVGTATVDLLRVATSTGIGGLYVTNAGNVNIGTTTSAYPLTSASTTGSQLALSAGSGFAQWAFRNVGGNFYLGTTTVAGTATTTVPALTIINNGGVGIFDSGPDFSLEIGGFNANGYFGITKTNDGDIFNINTTGLVGIGTTTQPSLLTLNPTSAQQVSLNPLFLIGTSTLVSANSGGTDIGINSPTGWTGDYLNFQNAGTASYKMSQSVNGFGTYALGTSTFSTVPGKQVIATSSTSQTTWTDGLGGTTPWNVRSVGSNLYFATSSATSAATSTTATITITSNGFVGIATSSPGKMFSVNGTALFSSGVFMSGLTTSGSSQTIDLCANAGSEVISDSAVCIVSDPRAKNITGTFNNALDEIHKIEAITYFYKPEFNGSLQSNPNFSREQLGISAKALGEIDPKLVKVYEKDGKNDAFSYKKGEAAAPDIYALVTLALAGVNEITTNGIKTAKDKWPYVLIVIQFALFASYVVYNEKKRK